MMVNVVVFYNPVKERNPRRRTEDIKRVRGGRPFISPRMVRSADGTFQLLLDNQIRDEPDFCISPVSTVSLEHRPSIPQESFITTEKGNLKLKSQCCEKYLKGKRCRRCPCFDLQ